jgi:hypothetical protein
VTLSGSILLPHSTAILSYSLLYFNTLNSPNAFSFRSKYGTVLVLYDGGVMNLEVTYLWFTALWNCTVTEITKQFVK